MITFGLVDEGQALAVYQWHRGFTSANTAVRQRTWSALEQLIEDRSLWHASEAGDYLGLAYASHDFERRELEIGGLMVAEAARGRGVGSTLMQLALAHILISQRPLRTPGTRVLAHVLDSNPDPRGIIEGRLRFRKAGRVKEHGSLLSGLRADEDGFVRGDEFELVVPDTLEALADWAASWTGRLSKGDPAQVDELTEGMTIASWATPLREMAGDLPSPA